MLSRLPLLDGPSFGLAVSLRDSDTASFQLTYASLKAQIHPHWALAVAVRITSPWSRRKFTDLVRGDDRVSLVECPSDTDNVTAIGAALAQCQGAFRGIVDCGDTLAPTALYEFAAALAAQPQTTLIYSDEDQLYDRKRSLPRFKPFYSPEAMQGGDLLGQLTLYRSDLIDTIGGWNRDTKAALAQRAATASGICHVPAVLYHRAGPPPEATLAAEKTKSSTPPSSLPRVSVIVCTRDHASLLAACTEGVLTRTDYADLELLIVDNGSTEPAALALLEELSKDPRVRVLRHPGAFNFAALNNAAAASANGDILLLLNNDVDVISPGWLRHLVAHVIAPGVGAAGAKLLYPDGTVQHAGLLLGPAGAATHVGRHAPADAPGYLGQLSQSRGLSVVTGACLAVHAAAWRQVGGMDERLAVTWNDVDLCLRLGAVGLRVVWTPDAVLFHHESASRGLESEDPAKLARFRAEQALMREIWGSTLDHDPFLNPNLRAEESGRLSLARPRHLRPWERPPVAP